MRSNSNKNEEFQEISEITQGLKASEDNVIKIFQLSDGKKETMMNPN